MTTCATSLTITVQPVTDCTSDPETLTPADLIVASSVSLGQRTIALGALVNHSGGCLGYNNAGASQTWSPTDPGVYELRYVSGTYGGEQGGFVTNPGPGPTFCDNINQVGPFQGSTNLESFFFYVGHGCDVEGLLLGGIGKCSNTDIVAQSLGDNPFYTFCSGSGLAAFGNEVTTVELHQPGTDPTSGPTAGYRLTSGNCVVELIRSGDFCSPQPARVRIKDYATLAKPLLTTCGACSQQASATEWDGTLPSRVITCPGAGFNGTAAFTVQYFPFDPLTVETLTVNENLLAGFVLFTPFVYYVTDGVTGAWYCTISCQGGVLWQGRKILGCSAVGEYFRDNSISLCSNTLASVCVESY